MPYTHYERMSALDSMFLDIEDPSVHMHVGAVAIFENHESLRTAEGALDIDRIRDYVDGSLHQIPRFRQHIVRVPFIGQPVWVDEPRFKIRYHVRHTALPAPGGLRQLKRLAGRIMSQKLDRNKPMWEMWVVEGLENGRFALIVKAHHCMVDGIAGIDLLAALLRLEPEVAEAKHERTWYPRERPGAMKLLVDEATRRAFSPLDALSFLPNAIMRPMETIEAVRDSISGISEAVVSGFVRGSETALNTDIGPYRKFDWTEIDIDAIRRVRKAAGGTLNDVVLATVAGAVGRFLRDRGETLTEKTVFRALIPVSVRTTEEKEKPGNRVVNFMARLPVHEQDPLRRLDEVRETTARLKASHLASGTEVLEEISDHTFSRILTEFVQLSAQNRTYNIVVTNVPGPPMPIYFIGARLQEIYPLVPLFSGQALGIALFSYDGNLYWGFNADWDALPDLHEVALAVQTEFERLERAAVGEAPETTAPTGKPKLATAGRSVRSDVNGKSHPDAREH